MGIGIPRLYWPRRPTTGAIDTMPSRSNPSHLRPLVIDMQVGFVQHGSAQWISLRPNACSSPAEFADVCRSAGIPVILTSANTLNPAPNDGLRFTKAMAQGNWDRDLRASRYHGRTRARVRLYPITTKDLLFLRTDLEMQLRSRGRDTIVVTGTMTNFIAGEATARSGFDRAITSSLCRI